MEYIVTFVDIDGNEYIDQETGRPLELIVDDTDPILAHDFDEWSRLHSSPPMRGGTFHSSLLSSCGLPDYGRFLQNLEASDRMTKEEKGDLYESMPIYYIND